MLTKEELRKRFVSEGALVLFAHIREQDAVLAEFREVLEIYASECSCWVHESRFPHYRKCRGQDAREALAAHPAPMKECNCRLQTPAPRMFEHASDCVIHLAPTKEKP